MTFKTAAFALPSVLLLGLLAGCQEDRMFMDCAFDSTLKTECSLANELTCTNYSCAVADHPDCVDLLCLSYEGAQPRCTRECLVDDDCPEGSRCTTYALEGTAEKSACVKVEDQEKLLFVGCAGNAAACDQAGADLCLPVPSLGDICSQQCSNPCEEGDACTAYDKQFYCLTSCKGGAAFCTADEHCVPTEDTAWCLPKCDAGAEGCVTSEGRSFLPPGASVACNPHQGCPGRAFCLPWKDQGYFCLPCEYSIGQF